MNIYTMEEVKKKPKKLKKNNYKSIMKSLIETKSNTDIKSENNKKVIRSVTGGGEFNKIDKI